VEKDEIGNIPAQGFDSPSANAHRLQNIYSKIL
jgi:hypothetical protein